jgi:pilus assembly protein CpaE
MSGRPKPAPKGGGTTEISILLVDDIPETRENIKKLLAFEPDFKVVGSAGTGREGVDLAKELEPDIIIMDINMPDMDGLEATSIINKSVPTAAVIIMSVQNDADYMRRAMLAGARDFLTKPINMDDIYNTIRTVYRNHAAIRAQYEAMETMPMDMLRSNAGENDIEGDRAGNIIAIYSPQGGAGTTTIATNLASALMKENVKVLLVDADLQFGDIGTFLNLQPQSTIVELIEDVDDLDIDLFDNILMTHDSGLKVLMGPSRPEFADEVLAHPGAIGAILSKIATNYDFIIVDTSTAINEILLGILDTAVRILLVVKPTLVSVKNSRFALDLFDRLEYPVEKTSIIVNQVWDERKGKAATISAEKIENYLKHGIIAQIPVVDERILLSAINKGVPIIATDKSQDRPPVRQIIDLADGLYDELMGHEVHEEDTEAMTDTRKRSGIAGLLGR